MPFQTDPNFDKILKQRCSHDINPQIEITKQKEIGKVASVDSVNTALYAKTSAPIPPDVSIPIQPGGGGGDSSMKCPELCVGGLKTDPFRRTSSVKIIYIYIYIYIYYIYI